MLIALAVPPLVLLALGGLGWAVVQGIAERVEADDPPPYRPYAAEPPEPAAIRAAPAPLAQPAPSLRRHFFEHANGLR